MDYQRGDVHLGIDLGYNDKAIGIVESYWIENYWIKKSIFHFKFKLRGNAINFCIKYNIPLANESIERRARIIRI